MEIPGSGASCASEGRSRAGATLAAEDVAAHAAGHRQTVSHGWKLWMLLNAFDDELVTVAEVVECFFKLWALPGAAADFSWKIRVAPAVRSWSICRSRFWSVELTRA